MSAEMVVNSSFVYMSIILEILETILFNSLMCDYINKNSCNIVVKKMENK